MKKLILLFLILFIFIGCGGYISYNTYKYEIIAKETNTGRPAANYPMRIVYPYDHYGVFCHWNSPNPVDAILDDQGRTKVDIANFYQPHLVVGSTIFCIGENTLKKGGTPSKFNDSQKPEHYKMRREHLKNYKLPVEQYPEVDVVIEKRKTDNN
ncbi:MAG: hypothetical protein ABSC11_14420 [Smithella sp.]|jgi:hypothetical protein